MFKCDPMKACLFWPLLLSLQYKLILSIIQHIQLGCILLLSTLWAESLGIIRLLLPVAICLFPSLWQGIWKSTRKLLRWQGCGCVPVPVGVAAISAGRLRQGMKARYSDPSTWALLELLALSLVFYAYSFFFRSLAWRGGTFLRGIFQAKSFKADCDPLRTCLACFWVASASWDSAGYFSWMMHRVLQ